MPGLALAIGTIDLAQGTEADVVITSTVRANSSGDMGFVNQPARWNVTVSRTTAHLITVGNLTGYRNAMDAEFPAMVAMLRQANCIKKVHFNPDLPGMARITFEDVPAELLDSLSSPLVIMKMRTATYETAAELC